MKLLLDENLPKRLKRDFPEFQVYTVRDMSWNGKKNGELMKLMQEYHFTALITFDKNLAYQQNFNKYPIPVIVLNASDNSYITLCVLVDKVKYILLSDLSPGLHEVR